MIYLDYNATAPLRKNVIKKIHCLLREKPKKNKNKLKLIKGRMKKSKWDLKIKDLITGF